MENGSKHPSPKQTPPSADFSVENPKDSDLVIVLMGAVGCGKSTFINTLLEKEVAVVGHELQAYTNGVEHFVFNHAQYPEHRILLVEMPGFDNPDYSDIEILRRIAFWLTHAYEAGMKVAGIVHLHDISSRRLAASTMTGFGAFEQLCGVVGAKNTVLATTMWHEVSPEAGAGYENQLREGLWGNMLSKGSTIHRVHLTRESVLGIVDSILSQGFVSHIQIQREMVDEKKRFTDTAAYVYLDGAPRRKTSGQTAAKKTASRIEQRILYILAYLISRMRGRGEERSHV